MDKKKLAQQLLNGFGETLGVGPLALAEHTDSCVLVFDDALIVNIEFDAQTGRLVLSSYLHELPAIGAELVLRELLAANLYWHRTGGATLCLEEGTGGVLLTYAHSVSDLDAASLEALVQNFTHQAERWTRRLAETTQSPQVQAAPQGRLGTPIVFG